MAKVVLEFVFRNHKRSQEFFFGLKKGDKVLVSATEFGQLEDESLVACHKGDEKIFTAKKNLQVDT